MKSGEIVAISFACLFVLLGGVSAFTSARKARTLYNIKQSHFNKLDIRKSTRKRT